MKHRSKSHRPGKTGRSAVCLFLLFLVFMVHTPPAEAQRNTLNGRFTAVSQGGTVSLGAGETITFENGAIAILVNKLDLTLAGASSQDFASKIGSLSGLIAGQGSSITLSSFKRAADGWKTGISYTNSIARGTLSGIVGGAPPANRSQSNPGGDDNGKWLTTPSTSQSAASYGNGLSLRDLRLGDVEVLYTGGSFVNGLIGNDNLANSFTSMGDIRGNVFNSIGVTLTSGSDTNYLAGGGMLGVRSTAGTAEISAVSDNIFDGINILTTTSSGGVPVPADSVNAVNNSPYLEGGGLIGVNGVSSPGLAGAHALLGVLSNNYFTNIHIGSNDILLGGGLVGVNNNSQNTDSTLTYSRLGTAHGNIFGSGAAGDITITLNDSLRGGGVIGVNGLSAAAAELPTLADNAFAGISMATRSYIKGGGIVGLQTNDGKVDKPNDSGGSGTAAQAALGAASGNLFLNQTVTAGSFLEGGGVIGLRSNLGMANLGALENNIFSDITVTTSGITGYLHGGGIVGLHGQSDISNATTTLEKASGNFFLNQKVVAGTHIEGGGVIGLRSNEGIAELRALTGNVFRGIDVNSGEAETISGGGVVGLSATTQALMGQTAGIRNNIFDDIRVTAGTMDDGNINTLVGNYLLGGGIIGVHARDTVNDTFNWATLEGVDHNSFTKSVVTSVSINGGGIIGVNSGGAPDDDDFIAGLAALGQVTNNTFDNLTITTVNQGDASGPLEGGGVIGVWNKDSTINSKGDNANYGVSAIDAVDNNSFTNIEVTAGTYLQGGGIIGIRGSSLEQMGSLTRNTFTDNTIKADSSYIDGGGIIGVTSRDGTSPYAGIKLIGESLFARNTVTAASDVLGGIVYSYGLTNVDENTGMTIRNSQFSGNTLTSTAGIVYGAVTVDTGAAPMSGNTNTLTLTAEPGSRTEFMNNEITDTLVHPLLGNTRTNSLYFGTINEPGGNPDPAAWSPELIVNPQAGGVVALYDPIWVNQADPDTYDDNYIDDNGTPLDNSDDVADSSDYSFTMNVGGAGDFIWGGTNVFTLDTASALFDNGSSGTVTLEAGSNTTLLDGSSTTTFVSGRQISGDYVNTMSLDAPNFKFALESGATLNVEGHNSFNLSGDVFTSDVNLIGAGDQRGDTVADLNGTLHFNLHNTSVYSQGEVPSDYSGNPDYQPLLTITVPAGRAGQVSLAGSTVSLSDFRAGPKLNKGDRFYLIELDNSTGPVFTSEDPANNTAYARQGLLTGYTFTVDKNRENLGREEETRFLVARLTGVEPAPEFDPPHTGRTTGVTVLQRVSDRLPEIELFVPGFPEPLYDLCDPCALCGPADPCRLRETRDPADWAWGGFADLRGSWFRVDTGGGHTAYADIRAAHYLAGLAAQRQLRNGGIQLGLFVDGSRGNYDTLNRVFLPGEGLTTLRGEGEIDSIGGGALLRRTWNNGFSVDLTARAGRLTNRFFSGDILTHDGVPARYRLSTPYLGASIGVNREWQYGEKNTFDLYGRYSWLRENGGHVRLSSNETVNFEALDSHRLIAGARWTRQTDSNLSWYIGGAYERELDGASRAVERSHGGDLVFDGISLRGDAGVGQIGLILTPGDDHNFSVTVGLEGYIGQRKGGSGFISAAWTW